MSNEDNLVSAMGNLIPNSRRLALKDLTPAAINRLFKTITVTQRNFSRREKCYMTTQSYLIYKSNLGHRPYPI